MKKQFQNDADVVKFMAKIQAQLAVLDQKLDSFMTKSLTELAEARAAQTQKPPQVIIQRAAPVTPRPPEQRPGRPMYDVVCFDCGKDTQIPFKPSGDRPVYCKECFSKRRSANLPKINEPKPAAAPSIQSVAPVVTETKPAAKQKAAPAKKASAKKKVVVKKKSKKK